MIDGAGRLTRVRFFIILQGMKKLVLSLIAPVFAGCLTSAPLEIVDWPVEFSNRSFEPPAEVLGTLRVSQVVVSQPYDSREFVVLRSDGSLARDAYNRFADSPAQLLKGPTINAFVASGRFAEVVGSSSSAASEFSAEATITKLAFDCRAGKREALVEIRIKLLDRARAIVKTCSGVGTCAIGDDYGAAFGEAFSDAIASALKGL